VATAFYAEAAEEELARIAERLASGPYSPGLEKIKPIALQSIRDNFTSSATPDNSDWPPRKHIGDGHPLLIDTGSMLQAATGGGVGAIGEIGSMEMVLGVDGSAIPYAATHNYGSPNRNIPAREFEGMKEDRIDEAAEVLADFVLTDLIGD